MIVDLILRYLANEGKTLDEAVRYDVEKLAGAIFRRQFMEDEQASKPGTLRISQLGKCARQQAYKFHGFPIAGKELDARSKFNFFMGDLTELMIVMLAKIAIEKYGKGFITATGLTQSVVRFVVNDFIIEGHPDGLFFAFEDKKMRLVEVKSMSSFAFEQFERGVIEESYQVQASTYMETLGVDECVFIAYNKNNGVPSEQVVKKNTLMVDLARDNVRRVLGSKPDVLPVPKFESDDKGFYPWNCLYCAYWKHCHPQAEQVLVKNSYKLKEGNGTA